MIHLVKPATWLAGYIPDLPTPFDERDRIDLTAFAKLCERQIEAEVSAIVVGETAGEASTLTPAEHDSIVRAAVIPADVIGIGTTGLGTIIPGSPQILHRPLSILPARMLVSRDWIDRHAKVLRAQSKTANKFRLSRNSAKGSSRFLRRRVWNWHLNRRFECKAIRRE